MYDVYLSTGCQRLPDTDDVARRASSLAEPTVQAKLTVRHPGFLGLDLSEAEAHAALEVLKVVHARGQVAPSEYRRPHISIQTALPIARKAIAGIVERRYSAYTFERVRYRTDGPRWWIFVAASPQLIEKGVSPGAVFAYIDKLDGHVWEAAEMAIVVRASN